MTVAKGNDGSWPDTKEVEKKPESAVNEERDRPEPEWDDMEDELPPSPIETEVKDNKSLSDKGKSGNKDQQGKSEIENTSAYRVMQSAPWILEPALLDDIAGRDINETERTFMQDAANAVTRIESAAGANEETAQNTGVITAESVANSIRYPINDQARMPKPATQEEREQIIERNRALFADWMNAESDDDQHHGNEPY